MKSLILFLCQALCFSVGFAQDPDPEYKELFGASYTFSTMRQDSIQGTNQHLEAFVNQPLFRKKNQFMGIRLGYHYNQISRVNELLDQKLTGIDLNLIWQWKWKDSSRLQINAQGGFFSDFKDISASDFRGRIAANYLFRISKKLKIGVGIAYARQFEAHQISPFISVNYRINSRWHILGVLPVKPVLLFKVTKTVHWRTEIQGKVESYRLSAKTTDNAVIDKSGWYVSTGADWLVKKHHRFSGAIGYSFKQNLRYYADSEINNWKIFTFDLYSKNTPLTTVSSKGFLVTFKYTFVF